MQKRWNLPSNLDVSLVSRLATELSLPHPLAMVLIQRGYDSVEKANYFLKPRLANLQAPENISGISKAVDRLQSALQKKEKIVLYGDYDVDGITSLALLCRSLRKLGADVDCFIPERATEGYGLTKKALNRCLAATKSTLIIAIDCATNAYGEACFLQEQGIDLLVVDHHQLAERTVINAGITLVNPHMGNDYHYLCSVGLVFKLVHALLKRYPKPPLDLRHYLDLVALGTVADIVPLIEENRIFVAHGLQQLAQSDWPGLKALIEVAEMKPPYTTFDIGYRLAPRLNAAGRLCSALEALELLLTDDSVKAARLARELDVRNRDRQLIERSVTLEAEELVTTQFAKKNSKSIVLGRPHWHHGVVGIVASRIAKRWHRPTLIIGFDEEGIGKGSGRSIEGFSLVTGLQECSHLLEAFGGHAMAAGLTLKASHLEAFSEAFEQAATLLLTEEALLPSLTLNGEVSLNNINETLLVAQDQLAPFGTANAQPLFLARHVRPLQRPRVLKEKHLRFECAGMRGAILTAIFFNGALNPLPKEPWDIAFTVERNTYQGRTTIQLQIVALREATSQ